MTKKEKYYLFKRCQYYQDTFYKSKDKYGLDDKLTTALQGKYYAISQLICDLDLRDQYRRWKINQEVKQ